MNDRQSPVTQVFVAGNDGVSGLGLAGLILSVLGWFTCGLLCIPGAIASFFGLFSSKPKGLAIAGLVVGFPGTIFFIVVGAGMMVTFLGLGTAAVGVATTGQEMQDEIARELEQHDQYPVAAPFEDDLQDQAVMDEPIELEPEPEPIDTVATQIAELEKQIADLEEASTLPIREWSDSSGSYKTMARLVGTERGVVILEKEGGQRAKVPYDRLSIPDRTYITGRAEKLKQTNAELEALRSELEQLQNGNLVEVATPD